MREENVLKYFPDIHTAADLIDQSSNSWKKELIKRISYFSSAKKILSIPLAYITVQEFITSLVLRNIVSDVYCPFYGGDDEILDHILISCPLERAIWFTSESQLGLNVSHTSLYKNGFSNG